MLLVGVPEVIPVYPFLHLEFSYCWIVQTTVIDFRITEDFVWLLTDALECISLIIVKVRKCDIVWGIREFTARCLWWANIDKVVEISHLPTWRRRCGLCTTWNILVDKSKRRTAAKHLWVTLIQPCYWLAMLLRLGNCTLVRAWRRYIEFWSVRSIHRFLFIRLK